MDRAKCSIDDSSKAAILAVLDLHDDRGYDEILRQAFLSDDLIECI